MKVLPICACIGLAVVAMLPVGTASAVNARSEIYLGAGTTGGTVGYGYAFGDHTAVRVEGNFLNFSHSVSYGSSRYEGKLKFRTFGLYYDFFPLGPLRLTGGVLVGSNKFEGSQVVRNGSVTINGQSYDATGQYVNSTIDFRSTSPYLGIGWGHHPGLGPGFYTDLGVIFGRPSATITVSPALRQAAGSQNIAAEQADLQRQADHLRFYPVIRMGIDFHF
jgi:opacity protein-like surface antigen